jgi:hypothetical protein
MKREAGEHENFFIAKNRDSESVPRAFDRRRRVATTPAARRSFNARITKTPAAQSLPAISTVARIGFPGAVRIVACMVCHVVGECTSRALTSPRQYFLKQDTVFLDVLVYSGCSASRFPSARSDKAISLHQEGNMAKKAKKAKSAVKKTAKKTRKVSKKK